MYVFAWYEFYHYIIIIITLCQEYFLSWPFILQFPPPGDAGWHVWNGLHLPAHQRELAEVRRPIKCHLRRLAERNQEISDEAGKRRLWTHTWPKVRIRTFTEWVSFLGSWGLNRSTGQTKRINDSWLLGDLFVLHSNLFPINPEKRHSFLIFTCTMLPTKTLSKILWEKL